MTVQKVSPEVALLLRDTRPTDLRDEEFAPDNRVSVVFRRTDTAVLPRVTRFDVMCEQLARFRIAHSGWPSVHSIDHDEHRLALWLVDQISARMYGQMPDRAKHKLDDAAPGWLFARAEATKVTPI